MRHNYNYLIFMKIPLFSLHDIQKLENVLFLRDITILDCIIFGIRVQWQKCSKL